MFVGLVLLWLGFVLSCLVLVLRFRLWLVRCDILWLFGCVFLGCILCCFGGFVHLPPFCFLGLGLRCFGCGFGCFDFLLVCFGGWCGVCWLVPVCLCWFLMVVLACVCRLCAWCLLPLGSLVVLSYL